MMLPASVSANMTTSPGPAISAKRAQRERRFGRPLPRSPVMDFSTGVVQQPAQQADESGGPGDDRNSLEQRRQPADEAQIHDPRHLARTDRIHAERKHGAPVLRVVA